MPVIEARPFEIPVPDGKAQGPDQVESGTHSGTGAGDVARILGDFGLAKDDVQVYHDLIISGRVISYNFFRNHDTIKAHTTRFILTWKPAF